jgi:tyrosyl-tRNA synthetase
MLIGSFTGMIGDPTDKSAARQKLTRKQVLENASTYKKQASKILSFTGKNPAKIMFNHKWLGKLSFEDIVDLASNFTVQQMLERDMFERRMQEGKPIYLHEFFYPLMQGYDSVAMDVDLEVGGSDQTFNMLAGRTLMKAINGKEKIVMALKLITNDEGKKMSKSEGGFVALNDAPEEMFGKIMAMDDSVIIPYFELATNVSIEEIAGKKIQMEQGVNPRDIKSELAHEIVSLFHNARLADIASEHFKNVFQKHETPDDMKDIKIINEESIVDVLVRSGLVSSKNEARRMIEQKAIKIDGKVVDNINFIIDAASVGKVLQRGKRYFVKITK